MALQRMYDKVVRFVQSVTTILRTYTVFHTTEYKNSGFMHRKKFQKEGTHLIRILCISLLLLTNHQTMCKKHFADGIFL